MATRFPASNFAVEDLPPSLPYPQMSIAFQHDELERSRYVQSPWMLSVEGRANMGSRPLATIKARLVRRHLMRYAFWEEMRYAGQETCTLALDVFDRYGRLNQEYYEHSIRKGSGCWSRELNHGDIFLVESVEQLDQDADLGNTAALRIVKALLNNIRQTSTRFFTFARPTSVTLARGQESISSGASREIDQTNFWRSLGFRRVGCSQWLAYTDQDTHPSRKSDAGQDWDPPPAPPSSPPHSVRRALGIFAAMERAISEGPFDPGTFRRLQETLTNEAMAPPWHQAYQDGDSILHIAATHVRCPELVSYLLLSRSPELGSRRNRLGYTPLEALQRKLERKRSIRMVSPLSPFYPSNIASPSSSSFSHSEMTTQLVSDSFRGFDSSDVACLAVLLMGRSSVDDDDFLVRLKYGCSCGRCLGGSLSPRMRFALLCESESLGRNLVNEEEEEEEESDGTWKRENLLEPSIREFLWSPERRGILSGICGRIAECLADTDRGRRVPYREYLFAEYSREVLLSSARKEGGTWGTDWVATLVGAVGDAIFAQAMKHNEWTGDGSHVAALEAAGGSRVLELPVCRNDDEFGFVSAMCGYTGMSPGG